MRSVKILCLQIVLIKMHNEAHDTSRVCVGRLTGCSDFLTCLAIVGELENLGAEECAGMEGGGEAISLRVWDRRGVFPC